MEDDEKYSMEVGHSIVECAFDMPGEDVPWDTVPSVTEGFWMANAVEIASLVMRSPLSSPVMFTGVKGGA